MEKIGMLFMAVGIACIIAELVLPAEHNPTPDWLLAIGACCISIGAAILIDA